MGRYLITTETDKPFFTNWFDAVNHFNKDGKMVVYDLAKGLYTHDGKMWYTIDIDTL
jgi:hypothetical protein